MKRIRQVLSFVLAVMVLYSALPIYTTAAEIPTIPKIMQVSLGSSFSGAVTTSGELYMWGNNYYGQLGNASTEDVSVPVKVMDGIAAIELGVSTSTALTTDGVLYVWGYSNSSSSPVKTLENVKQMYVPHDPYATWRVAAITNNNDLYVWGNNSSGEVGDGTTTTRSTPVKVLSSVSKVDFGVCHTAAITMNGDLYMWGNNGDYRLGDGTTTNRLTPTKVLSGIADVCLGTMNSAALTTTGTLYTWGDNSYGQIGMNNYTAASRKVPYAALSNVKKIVYADSTTVAVTKSNQLYAWGWCRFSSFGPSDYEYSPKLFLSGVSSFLSTGWLLNGYILTDSGSLSYYDGSSQNGVLEDVNSVYAGRQGHYAALTKDGDLYTWGSNSEGQLGIGTNTDSTSPDKVSFSAQNSQDDNKTASFNGHTYQLFDDSMAWSAAKTECENLGGHLVTINSAEEQTFLIDFVKTSQKKNIWIGAYPENGSYKWITNELFSYTSWASGEPNNVHNMQNAAMMYTQNAAYPAGTWNDENENGRDWPGYYLSDFGYICEWGIDVDPETCEHNFSFTTTKEPTCAGPGEGSFECSICGYSTIKEIQPLGHNFVDGVCSRCGEKEPCDSHLLEWSLDKGVFYCKNCGEEFDPSPVLGYKFGRDNFSFRNADVGDYRISPIGLYYLSADLKTDYFAIIASQAVMLKNKIFSKNHDSFQGSCYGLAAMNSAFFSGLSTTEYGASSANKLSIASASALSPNLATKLKDSINIMWISQADTTTYFFERTTNSLLYGNKFEKVISACKNLNNLKYAPVITINSGDKWCHSINIVGMLPETFTADYYIVTCYDNNYPDRPQLLRIKKDYSAATYIEVFYENDEEKTVSRDVDIKTLENNSLLYSIDYWAPGLRSSSLYLSNKSERSLFDAKQSALAARNMRSNETDSATADWILFLLATDGEVIIRSETNKVTTVSDMDTISSDYPDAFLDVIPGTDLLRLALPYEGEKYTISFSEEGFCYINYEHTVATIGCDIRGFTAMYHSTGSIEIVPEDRNNNALCEASLYRYPLISESDIMGCRVESITGESISIEAKQGYIDIKGVELEQSQVYVQHDNDNYELEQVAIGSIDSVEELQIRSGENSTVLTEEAPHSYKETILSPTCTEDGFTRYECTVCENCYSSLTIPALGHEWGEWQINQQPTCCEEGLQTRQCTRCAEVESSTIITIPHQYVDGVCIMCGQPASGGEVYSGTCGAEGDGSNLTWSFNSATGLLSITGSGAMKEYDNYTGIPWYPYRASITTISLPDDIKSICNYAFMHCTALTCITIPYGVLSIGDYAFYDCIFLTSVSIPGSIAQIGYNAFCECVHLESVMIPDGVTTIGDYAFSKCSSLTALRIPDSVKTLGRHSFERCAALTTVAIGKGVTEISEWAFSNCRRLTRVIIGEGVRNIGYSAFRECESLTSITLPDNITGIDACAFIGCSALESIALPDRVNSIGWSAFEDCITLMSIQIPESLSMIDQDAFKGCTGLVRVDISDLAAWCGISFANESANPLHYAHKLYLYGDLITDLILPDTVLSIGNFAFYDCTELTNLTISNSVVRIGNGAFCNCTGLGNISSPNNVTWIGAQAFYNTAYYNNERNWQGKLLYLYNWLINSKPDLTSAEIEEGTVYIGNCVFYNCTELTNIIVPNTVISIGDAAFYGCTGLESINIPESVTNICASAFGNCIGFSSLTIPDSVTDIGDYAFYKCSELTDVYFGGTEAEWNAIAFGKGNEALTSAQIHYNRCGHPHTHSEYANATCTDPGYDRTVCDDCGEIVSETVLPALGHDLVSHAAKLATCTETGLTAGEHCSRCDYKVAQEVVPALGHDLVHHDVQAETCTEIGWAAYDTCTRCDFSTYTEIEALGHDLIHHEAKAATCTEIGWAVYDTCTRCDYSTYTEIEALGHDLIHHEAKAATCTEIGWNAYDTCTRCDYTTYKEIAALDHDLIHHEAKAATCTEIGWAVYDTCTRCDYSTYTEIEALGHNLIHHEAQAATCTEIGWEVYDTCSRCDYTTYKEIAALDHDLIHHEAKAATCTEIGWNAYDICSRCDYTTYEELAALDHDLIHHEAKAATCTKIGWAAYDTCTRCDYTTYEAIPAAGHTPSAAVKENEVAPTCTEAGSCDEVIYCSVCNSELSREVVEIAALGHDLIVDPAKPATCTETGLTEGKHCTRCDYKVEQTAVPMTAHTFKNGVCTVCGAKDPDYKPPVQDNPFNDVKQGEFYYDAVLWAVNANPQVTSGTSATTFSPSDTCTRAQVVTFLWRAKGCPEPKSNNNPFRDVKAGEYYYKAVLWAVENGITSGTSATTFSPNEGCTRAQVVTFLWRTEGQPKPTSSANPFKDVTGGYYYDAVLWAVEKNITAGTSATTFSPDNTCTRGQIVTFLYRAFAG